MTTTPDTITNKQQLSTHAVIHVHMYLKFNAKFVNFRVTNTKHTNTKQTLLGIHIRIYMYYT